jgi:hypothetical protein
MDLDRQQLLDGLEVLSLKFLCDHQSMRAVIIGA